MAKKRRTRVFRWLLLAIFGAAAALTLRQGWLPARYTPIPAVDLDNPNNWFVDWRLAELKYERGLCRAVMIPPHVIARAVRDDPLKHGCGWINAVHITSAGGAHISIPRITCEAGAALALWITHDVQPLAQQMFASRVVSIHHMGIYACRNIRGHKFWRKTRSQHATANAIDIASFTLANGTRISVEHGWKSKGKKGRFLHAIHKRACRYFRVAIGPDYNSAHSNHFHYDRGPLSRCK